MKHPSVPKHSSINFYNNFGGANKGFVSRNNYTVMPFSTTYAIDGQGRDRYIDHNDGGLKSSCLPEMKPLSGNFFSFKKDS
jgi:hypothetical protein